MPGASHEASSGTRKPQVASQAPLLGQRHAARCWAHFQRCRLQPCKRRPGLAGPLTCVSHCHVSSAAFAVELRRGVTNLWLLYAQRRERALVRSQVPAPSQHALMRAFVVEQPVRSVMCEPGREGRVHWIRGACFEAPDSTSCFSPAGVRLRAIPAPELPGRQPEFRDQPVRARFCTLRLHVVAGVLQPRQRRRRPDQRARCDGRNNRSLQRCSAHVAAR